MKKLLVVLSLMMSSCIHFDSSHQGGLIVIKDEKQNDVLVRCERVTNSWIVPFLFSYQYETCYELTDDGWKEIRVTEEKIYTKQTKQTFDLNHCIDDNECTSNQYCSLTYHICQNVPSAMQHDMSRKEIYPENMENLKRCQKDQDCLGGEYCMLMYRVCQKIQ